MTGPVTWPEARCAHCHKAKPRGGRGQETGGASDVAAADSVIGNAIGVSRPQPAYRAGERVLLARTAAVLPIAFRVRPGTLRVPGRTRQEDRWVRSPRSQDLFTCQVSWQGSAPLFGQSVMRCHNSPRRAPPLGSGRSFLPPIVCPLKEPNSPPIPREKGGRRKKRCRIRCSWCSGRCSRWRIGGDRLGLAGVVGDDPGQAVGGCSWGERVGRQRGRSAALRLRRSRSSSGNSEGRSVNGRGKMLGSGLQI